MGKLLRNTLVISLLIMFTGCQSVTFSSVSSSVSESSPSVSEGTSSSEPSPEIISSSSEANKEITVTFEVNNSEMGKIRGKSSQTITEGESISKVEARANLGYHFLYWSDGNENAIRENEIFNESVILTAVFDYEAMEMPILSIHTENGQKITSKTEYVNATLSAFNSDDFSLDEVSLGIRGRGNYSWSGTEKKSYRIKFDKKVNLFNQGKGEAKSWTLLAVHCDKTLLRTDAAYYFASHLNHLPFVSSSSFVELYLNGSYDGVYEVCDQIQVNPYRVNIDDSGSEDDIGYLVELDKNATEDVISISNGNTFEVKSEYENQSQLDYISSYLDTCYQLIDEGDKDEVDKYVDIDSAVDAYIVEELFKNLDVGWGSFYFVKPKGGKLEFGPVWDFDLCAGNASSDDYDSHFTSYKYTYVGNPAFSDYMQQSDWFTALRATSWFEDMVRERFEEVRTYAYDTVDHIAYMAETYNSSFNRNFSRWKIFSKKINREPSEIMAIKTFSGQVDYLKDWLNNRIDWLSSYYAGNEKDYQGYWYED